MRAASSVSAAGPGTFPCGRASNAGHCRGSGEGAVMQQAASERLAGADGHGADGLGDAELARLARRGEVSAFGAIMRRYNRRLYRAARSVLRDDGEAEDAVQEAYVRAFTGLSEFRGEAGLSTWLTRITINEALGRLRRRRPSVDLQALDAVQTNGAALAVSAPLAMAD